MWWAIPRRSVLAVPRRPASRSLLSAAAARRAFWSLSVAADPFVSKQRVLDAVRDAVAAAASRRIDRADGLANSAVVLTSPALAPWLGDDAFLSALLCASAPPGGDPPPELSVLAAVVDGIPQAGAGSIKDAPRRDGLSILHGDLASMLPDLWPTPSSSLREEQVSGSDSARDRHPSLTISLPPLRASADDNYQPLEATVPLANTIFHNGRPFTMFASRWQRGPKGSPALRLAAKQVNLRTQLIATSISRTGTETGSLLSAPLVPITQPREIVAGLGNIVRQLRINDKPSPASAELESVLPALLRSRASRFPDEPPGPVGVWALVVPAALAASRELPRCPGSSDESSEWEAAAQAAIAIADLLASGARLQKILSGGGGWGPKQGLLSLDPETRYLHSPSDCDADDIESFLRSLKSAGGGEEGAPPSTDVAAPESYVQFLIEPSGPRPPAVNDTTASGAVIVGTCGTDDGEVVVKKGDEAAAEVEVATGWFGALSARGVFFSSAGRGPSTKIDAPNCRVVYEPAVEEPL